MPQNVGGELQMTEISVIKVTFIDDRREAEKTAFD